MMIVVDMSYIFGKVDAISYIFCKGVDSSYIFGGKMHNCMSLVMKLLKNK